jgi:hypothetical protein
MFDYSISKFYNYIQKDYIIDWLNLYGQSLGFKKDKKDTTFMDNGNNIEKKIISTLLKDTKYTDLTHLVFKNHTHKARTINELNDKNVDIIYQGFVSDDTFYGLPDLIVRKSVVNKWIKEFNKNTNFMLEDDDTFVIVDIKSSCKVSDGRVQKNTKNYAWLQFQMSMYCDMLSNCTDKVSKEAYVMSLKGEEILLGKLDINTIDKKELITYMKSMREEGSSWYLYPVPNNDYLYPNMKNEYDQEWRSVKLDIAKKIGEWTLLSHVTLNDRKMFWDMGMKTFKSKDVMENINKIPSKINKSTIEVNQEDVFYNIKNGDKVKSLINEKIDENCEVVLYVDIETLYVSSKNKFYPFLACIYSSVTNQYQIIMCENDQQIQEDYIIKQISDVIRSYSDSYKSIKIIHFSGNESSIFEKYDNVIYIDLYDIMKRSEFAVTGLYSLKLKDIYVNLIRNRSVTDISNGFDAMTKGFSYYFGGDKKDKKLKKNLEEYVKRDVEILVKIYNFFINY